MDRITLITGGCRSGKSRHALELAEKIENYKKIFIATCKPQDDEMKARVALHQKERNPIWNTLEVPTKLPQTILEIDGPQIVVLVDCLTLWVSNLLLKKEYTEIVENDIPGLINAARHTQCHLIFVSNEVGTGIVPENSLARMFRDLVGQLNQNLASVCQHVIWMVAGIPVAIKEDTQT